MGALAGALATLVTIVGGFLGIKQYYDQNPGDVSGQWVVENQTVKSTLTRYHNMKLTYSVFFVQNGNNLTGNGEKTVEQEDGKAPVQLVGKHRTRITINGSVSKDSIHANYVEDGTRRSSDGEFDWKHANGVWVGTFSSLAADSTGSSSLKRH